MYRNVGLMTLSSFSLQSYQPHNSKSVKLLQFILEQKELTMKLGGANASKVDILPSCALALESDGKEFIA